MPRARTVEKYLGMYTWVIGIGDTPEVAGTRIFVGLGCAHGIVLAREALAGIGSLIAAAQIGIGRTHCSLQRV